MLNDAKHAKGITDEQEHCEKMQRADSRVADDESYHVDGSGE